MRALQTEITRLVHSPVAVMEKKELKFSSALHCHPELELVYIKSGTGKRIIGNSIDHFEAGEVILIGSGLPHRWIGEPAPWGNGEPPCSIVAYFDKDIFTEKFYDLGESRKLSRLISDANRGIILSGETKNSIGPKMKRLTRKTGFKKIIGLLDILHTISISKEVEYIMGPGYSGAPNAIVTDRLFSAYKYITDNYQKDISLEEIAGITHLTTTAFCRLFKKRTNKKFVEYLNEIRISHACARLQETDLSITEIMTGCGFKTISNFNKSFKRITGMSPRDYRLTSTE